MSTTLHNHKVKKHLIKNQSLKVSPSRFTIVLLILLLGGFTLGSLIGAFGQPTKASTNTIQYSNQAQATGFTEELGSVYIQSSINDSNFSGYSEQEVNIYVEPMIENMDLMAENVELVESITENDLPINDEANINTFETYLEGGVSNPDFPLESQ